MRIKQTMLPREQHETYIGLDRSLSIIKETGDVFIHDGVTAGGHPATGIPPYPVNAPQDTVYGLRDGQWVAIPARVLVRYTGPGPQELIYGDEELGYFGEVHESEFFTLDELRDQLGLDVGTPFNTQPLSYFKCYLESKIIYVPKVSPLMNLSWAELYQRGLVYGVDDVGTFPSGDPVNQIRYVELGNLKFKVRLFKGANSDPSTGINGVNGELSEWNRIMYRVGSLGANMIDGPLWESYSIDELGLRSDGRLVWMQESLVTNTNNKYIRGGFVLNGGQTFDRNSRNNSFGWRPILEYVSGR